MPTPIADVAPGLVAAVRSAMDEACEPLFLGTPNGPGLWRSIERTATAALARLQSDGLFVAFRVRCDPDTNEGSAEAPVVEVRLRLPRRVREIVLRMTVDGG